MISRLQCPLRERERERERKRRGVNTEIIGPFFVRVLAGVKMLTSFSLRSILLAVQVISLGLFVHAKTIVHDFNITWVTADPTGISPRPVIGINGRWPIPTIECEVGDRVIVNVRNQLGNQTTSLHFHGFFQRETASMDGAAGVTQCPIPPGSSLQYNLTVRLSIAVLPGSRQFASRWYDACRLTFFAGQSAWDLLVPCTRQRTISGWASRTLHRQRSQGSVQRILR